MGEQGGVGHEIVPAETLPVQDHQVAPSQSEVQPTKAESSKSVMERINIQAARLEDLFNQNPLLESLEVEGKPLDDAIEMLMQRAADLSASDSADEEVVRELQEIEDNLRSLYDAALQEIEVDRAYDSLTEAFLAEPIQGDVYVHPETCERLIVEGIQKKKNGKKTDVLVQYSIELEEGVPKEPKKNLYLKPLENFVVVGREYQMTAQTVEQHLRRTDEEFDEILSDCIGEFDRETVALTGEPYEKMEAQHKILQGVQSAWGKLEDEVSVDVYREKQRLIEETKMAIGRLPREFETSSPLINRIRREYRSSREANSTVAAGSIDREKKGRRRAGRDSGVSTDRQVKHTVSEPKYVRDTRANAEEFDRSQLDGLVDPRLVKYGAPRSFFERDWNLSDPENFDYGQWIAAIREVQSEMDILIPALRKAKLIRQWEGHVRHNNPDDLNFATEDNAGEIQKRLAEIESIPGIKQTGDAVLVGALEPIRSELHAILYRYFDIMRPGVWVLADAERARREQDGWREERRGAARQADRGVGREQRGRGRRFPEASIEGESNAEGQLVEMVRQNVSEIREQYEALDVLIDGLLRHRLFQKWLASLRRDGKNFEPFARSVRIKEVRGRLADIEAVLGGRFDGTSAERERWLNNQLAILGQYIEQNRILIEAGERVAQSAQRNRKRRVGRPDGDIIDSQEQAVTSTTELALIQGGIIPADLDSRIRKALAEGMDSVKKVAKGQVSVLDGLVASKRPDWDDAQRMAAIAKELGSTVEAALLHVYGETGLRIAGPAAEKRIAQALISNAQGPDQIQYGGGN